MRLKLDENLGDRVRRMLQDAGHDASTVLEQGLSGASDRSLIDLRRGEGRCLVTLDIGFANALSFNPPDDAGIVVLRLPPRPVPADLDRAVLTLVDGLAGRSAEGRLWIVQRGAIREHQPRDVSEDRPD